MREAIKHDRQIINGSREEMTNYEKIKSMSVDEMAETSVGAWKTSKN